MLCGKMHEAERKMYKLKIIIILFSIQVNAK